MSGSNIRGILIDPHVRRIDEITLDNSSSDSLLQNLYREIGCQLVEVLNIDGINNLWLDEEGLLAENHPAFSFNGHKLVGRAIILGGQTETEDSTSTELDLLSVADRVQWLGPATGR